MAHKDYEKWDKEELIAEIKTLVKRKKFGLVWEDKPEDVVTECARTLPVLAEVKKLAINTDADKPTNLLIEGDNYHALSVLNYTHKGKIDVMYIDPPYNTGARDWQYNNDYVDKQDGYRHSKWLSMMANRLKLAKGLLSDTGFICIAIDHNELFTLGCLCDEIFGENNRLGIVTVVHNPKGRNLAKFFSENSEFVFVYARNIGIARFNNVAIDEDVQSTFNLSDEHGKYRLEDFMRARQSSSRNNKPNFYYPIYVSRDLTDIKIEKTKGYIPVFPIKNGKEFTWKTLPHTFSMRNAVPGYFTVKKAAHGYKIYHKYRESQVLKNVWVDQKYQSEFHGTNLLKTIFVKNKFNYPKSVYAVLDFIKITAKPNSIVLDFFAGSGTTGHAVAMLNKEDGGSRRFILCTNNENGIAREVCYPRIKAVIKGNDKLPDITGIASNLQYYKTAFVPAVPTDQNKMKLTQKATEMLCVKENTFEQVKNLKTYKIFRNKEHYTAIIYNESAIVNFKKYAATITGVFSVYVFSYNGADFSDMFADMKNAVTVEPIPETILRIYRRIFKQQGT